jgi:hypothetical protein
LIDAAQARHTFLLREEFFGTTNINRVRKMRCRLHTYTVAAEISPFFQKQMIKPPQIHK